MSIPKVIHYCWFGKGEMPKIAKKCIKSWEKNCPDYEIKRWDETNFDINQNEYCKQAYEKRKWAFVLGKDKRETKRLRKIFEENNKVFPYPKD